MQDTVCVTAEVAQGAWDGCERETLVFGAGSFYLTEESEGDTERYCEN